MYLSRICIKNFRNFQFLDVRLGPTSVVVGENNVGKTNFLFALRLILDPKLPDFSRHLRAEDFWDGLTEPVKNGTIIEVTVELQDFTEESNEFTVLHSYCVRGPVVDTARLTYRFRPPTPRPEGRSLTIEDYEFVVFGGSNEQNRVDSKVRRWIPMEVLPALRDAERDLAAWGHSPLRPLIENLDISGETLIDVASSIDSATEKLLAEAEVEGLTESIQSSLFRMVGQVLQINPSLGFVPSTPERLTRALRLFGDGEIRRPVGELGLGVDNLLYLMLLTLELDRREAASETAKTIVAIEEPEAHLHPHLQRLVFRDFLSRGSPVLLTTHSPHIASVAPLNSLVLLRKDKNREGTQGFSTLQASLSQQEIADIERYLDATRAEVLFAKGVILVEGATELFLVPAVAEQLCKSLDEFGITVCSVHGVDFVPYAKLLGPNGLNVPFVVLTDGDPFRTKSGLEKSQGLKRAVFVAQAIGHSKSTSMNTMWEQCQWDELREAANDIGVFVGKRTIELDLVESGHGHEIVHSLKELGATETRVRDLQEMIERGDTPSVSDGEIVTRAIGKLGKGRLAQRFACKVDVSRIPVYITSAIEHITEILAR